VAPSKQNEWPDIRTPKSGPNLQTEVTTLVNRITDEAVRIVVAKVFADLVFLLDYLSLVEANPQELGRVRDRLSILYAVRGEANALVDFIENHALQCEGMDELLRETLDGTGYAIKHEVRRILDGELAEAKDAQDEQKVYGSLLHAQGVLTNCFQQCMISLARVFDENVTGAQLFHDWQIRRERSLLLCEDLTTLTELVQDSGKRSLDYIAGHLRSFKEGSMQWLMYKDWQEYEALSEQVIGSINQGENPTDLLHRLGCYLETLLAHVKTRGVLAERTSDSNSAYEEVAISW
jgi:hypothetical protein